MLPSFIREVTMSYTNDDIKARAELLCGGELSEESERVLDVFCAAAANELEAKLRRGVSSQDISELFVTAAGMLALALCMELENSGAGEISNFRAGNLSVSFRQGETNRSAASLRKAAENILSAYLEDSGFSFMGVKG